MRIFYCNLNINKINGKPLSLNLGMPKTKDAASGITKAIPQTENSFLQDFVNNPQQITVDYQCSITTDGFVGFGSENNINGLFQIEQDSGFVSAADIETAKHNLDELLKAIKRELLKHPEKPLGDKILLAYMVIEDSFGGYIDGVNSPLLTHALLNKEIDCDTSSLIILALAEELKNDDLEWSSIGMVLMPNHASLQYGDSYYDKGEKIDKSRYERQFGIPQDIADNPLRENVFAILANTTCGILAGRKNNYQKSIQYYDQALALSAYNFIAYYNRGINHFSLAQDKAIELDLFKNKDIVPSMADREFILQHYTKAIVDYTQASQITSKYAGSYYGIIDCCIDLIDLNIEPEKYGQLALATHAEKTRVYGEDMDSPIERAAVYMHLQNYVMAEQELYASLNGWRNDGYFPRTMVKVYKLLAEALRAQGKESEAARFDSYTVEDLDVDQLFQQTLDSLKAKDYDGAETSFLNMKNVLAKHYGFTVHRYFAEDLFYAKPEFTEQDNIRAMELLDAWGNLLLQNMETQ
ncbi:hypothetical protein NO2_0299 [Candidatus Termititenax persephonae]|uniref:Tetratricopeptide repeat protein n=1 Tax=Candidatus Termititenax persephonae TaxID=2218525 RepID=A0A388TF19_9BACT|nr:hypothetical protein NO2_0299 [Candidatus Termititenax persephonae]